MTSPIRRIRRIPRVRRRAALSAAAAAGLLAATPLLTACGSTPHPGAAAVVGQDRITVAQLQHQVADVREAQEASPQGEQLMANSARLGQDTLIRLIQYRIIEKAGHDNGVDVSRHELQEERLQVERANGGADAVQARFLALGIAPDQIDQALSMDLMRTKLDGKLGPARTNQVLMQTSEALRVDINPRYGTWDAKRGTARPVQEPWLRPAAPDPESPV
ncbi:SurA N-terminal domain-containing protein [Streptomyces sp. AV19]|uniref:SurA N-terminal domain-containing protein n=1 Tax=Streptomyces sp. AV19 TaxID=2793068 RepID=UPI0018FE56FB|nr:SurA N-terminal domain-containing protein [Streptomyces sp. AV19]MBH1935418.1 SurA N-terminal domain-containing protein [Streptomyces sp. AV19]MDG4531305.1 SurA N-terminal domain-containing protein [Streptomyces sp. AV19]